MTTQSLLQSALQYAERKWHVFPLHTMRDGRCTCGRDCDKNAAKHPRVKGGYKAATTDARQIERWWCRWPDANIGVATGAISGIVVLDIDGWDPWAALKDMEAKHEPIPIMLIAKTARGWHLYFKHPHPDLRMPCTAWNGIDIRGDGGYVVAPPSVHRTGHIYRWCTDVTP